VDAAEIRRQTLAVKRCSVGKIDDTAVLLAPWLLLAGSVLLSYERLHDLPRQAGILLAYSSII
jgi:hypothetical protein